MDPKRHDFVAQQKRGNLKLAKKAFRDQAVSAGPTVKTAYVYSKVKGVPAYALLDGEPKSLDKSADPKLLLLACHDTWMCKCKTIFWEKWPLIINMKSA